MRQALSGLALLFGVAGCGPSADWKGYVYPSAADLTQHLELGAFETFEQCQEAAIYNLRALGRAETGDYECGRACRFNADVGINVCAETRK
jgi:hypothetical protein